MMVGKDLSVLAREEAASLSDRLSSGVICNDCNYCRVHLLYKRGEVF